MGLWPSLQKKVSMGVLVADQGMERVTLLNERLGISQVQVLV